MVARDPTDRARCSSRRVRLVFLQAATLALASFALASAHVRSGSNRGLITGYEKDAAHVLSVLSPLNLDTAIEILLLPESIRGLGPVKEKLVQDAKARCARRAKDLANPPPAPRQIAAE